MAAHTGLTGGSLWDFGRNGDLRAERTDGQRLNEGRVARRLFWVDDAAEFRAGRDATS